MHVSATSYAFDDANEALRDLAHDRVNGAAVLIAPTGGSRPPIRARGSNPG